MSLRDYTADLKAKQIIMAFMGELAYRYSNEEMGQLWTAVNMMRNRYGDIFIAQSIQKDKTGAELALFRYYKKHKPEVEVEVIEQPERWHRIYPKQKKIAKKLITLLAIGLLLGTMTITLVNSISAVSRSDAVIAEADYWIERSERSLAWAKR